MTMQQAIKQAQVRALVRGEIVYVVRDGHEYDTATDYDMDTFWAGVQPEYAVEPEGWVI